MQFIDNENPAQVLPYEFYKVYMNTFIKNLRWLLLPVSVKCQRKRPVLVGSSVIIILHFTKNEVFHYGFLQ